MKYLVCVDGSDKAKFAFDCFLQNIVRQDDHVVLVTAVKYIPNVYLESAVIDKTDERVKLEKEAAEMIRSYAEAAKKVIPNAKIEGKIGIGEDERDKICELAELENVDAVVCGARGSGAVAR